jgi:hypothetical protein
MFSTSNKHQGHIRELTFGLTSRTYRSAATEELRVPDRPLPNVDSEIDFPSQLHIWSRKFSKKKKEEFLMPIRDAAEAAIEGRFGEEAEDCRGQDIRAQEQKQEQERPEVCPEPQADRAAHA